MTAINASDPLVSTVQPVEETYRLHYDLLLNISVQRFGVPRDEAESLIHEVFVSYLGSAHEVRNTRSYLIGAICNASRHYRRSNGRTEALPDDMTQRSDPSSFSVAESVATRITIRETIGRLHEKCQKTLRLRYWEGHSASEVAEKLETTNRYAEKLIHKCLKRAHDIYRTLTKVDR